MLAQQKSSEYVTSVESNQSVSKDHTCANLCFRIKELKNWDSLLLAAQTFPDTQVTPWWPWSLQHTLTFALSEVQHYSVSAHRSTLSLPEWVKTSGGQFQSWRASAYVGFCSHKLPWWNELHGCIHQNWFSWIDHVEMLHIGTQEQSLVVIHTQKNVAKMSDDINVMAN